MAPSQRGRKAIPYDPKIAESVEAMSSYGLCVEGIAKVVGISPGTLRRLYRKEMDRGFNAANVAVGKKLFESCMAGDVTSLIFWAKTRMRWRETDKNAPQANPAETAKKELAEAFREAKRSVGE